MDNRMFGCGMDNFERLTEDAIVAMVRDKRKKSGEQDRMEKVTRGFKRRVVKVLLKNGWNIQYSKVPGIDFFSVRPDVKVKKAYRVKAHGHLSHKEQDALYAYGRETEMSVIYVHETSNREIEFIRLYPPKLRRLNKSQN